MAFKKMHIVLLIVLTFAGFGNTLWNGFVGNDGSLIASNPFYQSFSNLPKLFSSEYLTDPGAAMNLSPDDPDSGSGAYRPVSALTYFTDHALWRLKPWGYHLTNLLLHLVNTLLVYFLLVMILKKPSTAVLAAAVFCVHPLKSEAVSVISCRADLVACLFALSAFLFYLCGQGQRGHERFLNVFLSYFFFFLGLFSKESVIILPLILLAHDTLLAGGKNKKAGKRPYIGFGMIVAGYVWLYGTVFPHTPLQNVGLFGGTVFSHILTMVRVFGHYCLMFWAPVLVKLLPPTSWQHFDGMWLMPLAAALIITAWFVFLTAWAVLRKDRQITFFVLWFLLALVPVSNLIPLINPVAYRFLYFPSVGLCAVAALLIKRLWSKWSLTLSNPRMALLCEAGLIGMCLVILVPLNFSWKNNYIMAKKMVRDFPRSPAGYLYLALNYAQIYRCDMVEEALVRGMDLGLESPRALYLRGYCRVTNWTEARPFFEECVAKYPSFGRCAVGLGRTRLFTDGPEKALPYLKKGVRLFPRYPAYAYLIQADVMTGRRAEAEAVFSEAEAKIKEPSKRKALKILLESDPSFLPMNIGL